MAALRAKPHTSGIRCAAAGNKILFAEFSSNRAERAQMDNELCTAMLAAVFAAVMVVSGLVFIDRRDRHEAALLLRSLTISQAQAAPRVKRPAAANPPRRAIARWE
jgi:hypothetical protein